MHFPDFINYFSLSLSLGGVVAIVSSSLVYISDSKAKENVNWFLTNIFAAIWSFGYALMITTTEVVVAETSNLVLHAAAIFVPLFYLFFVLNLTKAARIHWKAGYAFAFLSLVFSVLNFSQSFVSAVIPKFVFNFAPDAGPYYVYFMLYFFATFIYALSILYFSMRKSPTAVVTGYVFYSTVLGCAGGGSVFFLTFNVNFPPYPIILFSLYPIVISYAILRHHLFNVKLIATEAFVILLWLIMVTRTIVAVTLNDRIFSALTLLGTIVIGILLLKGVIKEVRAREKIEALAGELATANERLTMLDRQKSEFLSIASHQLRSPLTAIKGYSSMLLEGSFGKIEAKAKEAVERIFLSSERLVIIVEDFLNVSRIEQGRMQYDFASVDMVELVDSAIKELEPNISRAGLSMTFDKASKGPFYITADYGKIRQVVMNIVDNSIKYTPKGSIKVRLEKDEDTRKVLLTVSDTGIGIPRESLHSLFQKFSRAPGAAAISTTGTGLGLYVVKEMMKAHKGNVWVDSPGVGKGSTFYLEFLGE